jgi:hypothetical protein
MTGRQAFVRTMITVGLPFILIWAFCAELWSGIRAAFFYAWCEVCINFDQYKTQMRRTDY